MLFWRVTSQAILTVVLLSFAAAAYGQKTSSGPGSAVPPAQFLLTTHGPMHEPPIQKRHVFGLPKAPIETPLGPDLVPPTPEDTASKTLSPIGRDVAQLLGIMPELNEYLSLRSRYPHDEKIQHRTFHLRHELMETLFTAHLEIHSVTSRIESDIALADNLQAIFKEREEKALRLNSIANFIAGGITGVVGNPIKIGGEDMPGDVLDTISGGVQASLASLAYHQQSQNDRQAKGVPTMLSKLFGRPTKSIVEYPHSVWTYLNSPPPDYPADQTRRKLLVTNWIKTGLIDRYKKPKGTLDERVSRVTGSNEKIQRLYIDDLAARSAMLHGLRAAVTRMDQGLLEIMWLIRGPQPSIHPVGSPG